MGYSQERKAAVLKRMLPPNNMAIRQLSKEEGISEGTLYTWRSQETVFVKQVVRMFHAVSLISETRISVSGFNQTDPMGCQFRSFPDQRCGFFARAVA